MQQISYTLNPEQKKSLFETIKQRSDRIFSYFMISSFIFGLFLASFYDTWFIGIAIGGLNLLVYFATRQLLPESRLYQYVGASILAVFMAQFIYQMHGLFEMHFFAFIACTLLITYSNWRLQIPLFILIVGHHAVFAYMQFIGVEGVYFTQLPYMTLSTFLFHAAFAGVIIFTCGLWSYYTEQKIIEDGIRAIQAEETLKQNLALAEAIKNGDSNYLYSGGDDPLSQALTNVREHLVASRLREDQERYISQGVASISGLLSELSKAETTEMAQKLLAAIAKYIDANQATFFLKETTGNSDVYLKMIAGYAFRERKSFINQVRPGEGLVGQAALERNPIIIRNIPEDYFSIGSSLGHSAPRHVIAWPMILDQELIGVMEFATFGELKQIQQEFLQEVSPRIASALTIAEAQRKTQALLEASEKLKSELQGSNQQLEAQTLELEEQKRELVVQNDKIFQARETLANKAAELEKASKYKSEFLANMSHELRTPLNSILILANMLAENKGERLSEKEVSHAKVIHKAGNDLLTLINDVLDLSKIESGKLDIILETVSLEEVASDMNLLFDEVADKKHIHFEINQGKNTPANMISDRVRLEQILKNLLSNAFKFTDEKGTVKLNIAVFEGKKSFRNPDLNGKEPVITFEVSDSGIGIPPEKQNLIFEAFSQADGSTSRKYGGTGLGLSISLQLSKLLGGEIQLRSEPGVGSTFSLFLPLRTEYAENPVPVRKPIAKPKDISYPKLAVTVLSIEDQELQSERLADLLSSHGIRCFSALNGTQGLEILEKESSVDCVILDMKLPDMSGMDAIRKIRSNPRFSQLPVIIHTGMDISQEMQAELIQYTQSIITKTTRSDERIMEELHQMLTAPKTASVPSITAPSISLSEPNLSKGKLKGRKVLLVDDDMRNVFAISAVLESSEMEIETAYNGREAMEKLAQDPLPDLMLLDIMMPEMDGYEVLKAIRENVRLLGLPVIATTAKAMESDREKCLEAGASEYLPKPLDTRRLIELMELFLEKEKI
ncbi:MAG: response regulator [Bacteroidia bacterium]|nr:response regulator [Bacteroidia bacterium]